MYSTCDAQRGGDLAEMNLIFSKVGGQVDWKLENLSFHSQMRNYIALPPPAPARGREPMRTLVRRERHRPDITIYVSRGASLSEMATCPLETLGARRDKPFIRG